MSFEIITDDVHGRNRVQYGTFSGTGEIVVETDFSEIISATVQLVGSAATVDTLLVTNTFPINGGDLNLTLSTQNDGIYKVEGT